LAHHAAGSYGAGQFCGDGGARKNSFLEEIEKTVRVDGPCQRPGGLSLYKHVFRNALIPIITGFSAAFIGAFTGSLLIEPFLA
jgi:microcin C transport system permease protein